MTTTELTTLKCKCGSFEATFDSLPYITFNCNCHSCASTIKAIESKPEFAGTSMKCNNLEHSGAAVAVFKSNNVTVKKVDAAKINFMKVGDEGKNARAYCTDCGTVLFNAWAPNWCAANRNALTNRGEEDQTLNIMCKYAFEPEKVPEPRHGMMPLMLGLKFVPLLTGLFCDGSNSKEKALRP